MEMGRDGGTRFTLVGPSIFPMSLGGHRNFYPTPRETRHFETF